MFDKLWEESPMVQKMREQFRAQYYQEGEVQSLRRTLVDVVQVRFPELTELAQKQAKLCNKPDILAVLIRQIVAAPDAKTAQWLLETTPEQ